MSQENYTDQYIETILDEVKTIAVVGASANQVRPSFFVVKYMLSKGYDVIPVNPGHAGKKIAGAMAVGSLAEIDRPVDMVDIFRNSNAAMDVTVEAMALTPLPKVIWMQLQVINQKAANLAESKGVKVIMNRCPKIEYARLCGEISWAGVATNVISSKKPKLQAGFQRINLKR